MMNKTVSMLMLAVGVTCVATANASEFNYDYAEVDYGVEGGDTNIDGQGNISIGGSYSLKPDVNVIASYSTNRVVNVFQGGVGIHKSIRRGTDALASLSYVNNNITGSGYGVSAGLRHDFTNDFEGEISVNFVDVTVSDTNITAGSRYHFNRDMSAGLGVDDTGTLIFNLRMNY